MTMIKSTLTLLICAWTMMGCGTPADASHRTPSSLSPSPSVTRQGAVSGGKALPIQAYMLTDAQQQVVHRAAQRIADECMKKQGFDVRLPDYHGESGVDGQPPDFLDRRYAAVYDRDIAAKYGLHVPSMVEHPVRPPDTPMSDAAVEALVGAEADRTSGKDVDVSAGRLTYGGCLGQAESKLAQGSHYLVALGEALAEPVRQLNLDHAATDAPAVSAAQAAWSACMAKSGYRLASTLADVDGVPGVDMWARRPSPAEIALALHDVACREKTHVVDIAFKAEAAYETKKIDEQAQVFAQVEKENEEVIQRAADLLGATTP